LLKLENLRQWSLFTFMVYYCKQEKWGIGKSSLFFSFGGILGLYNHIVNKI